MFSHSLSVGNSSIFISRRKHRGKVGKVVDKFTDREVTTWHRADPFWPL